MRLLSIACIAFLFPTPVCAADKLNIPIESTPCKTIALPDGSKACEPPKVTQRFNAAPRLVKLGDTIRTQRETDAKRLCHDWGGTHLIALPDEQKAWDCVKFIKAGWY
jgi:hypothetical protein